MSMVTALAAPAAAAANTVTITATGTAQVRVVPVDRHSNASIQAAELAAEKAGVPLALKAAQTQAGLYAAAAGLTLGPLVSISDQVAIGPFFGSIENVPGPFGPGRFCGIVTVAVGRPRPVVRVIDGKKLFLPPRHLRFRKVRRCIVPSPATTTLVASYSAS